MAAETLNTVRYSKGDSVPGEVSERTRVIKCFFPLKS